MSVSTPEPEPSEVRIAFAVDLLTDAAPLVAVADVVVDDLVVVVAVLLVLLVIVAMMLSLLRNAGCPPVPPRAGAAGRAA